MKSRKLLVPALAALVLLGACSDDTAPTHNDDAIRGQVIDGLGQPVSGASIMLEYVGESLPDKPQTGIRFTLPDAGAATIWIASYCDGDTVRMLVDEVLPAGEYTIIWDLRDDLGRIVPDGVYRVHAVTPAGHAQYPWVLFRPGYADLPPDAPVAAQATTDSLGRFRLAQDCLPFGHGYGSVFGMETITRRVRVWALHPDFVAASSEWAIVDAEDGADLTVTLVR